MAEKKYKESKQEPIANKLEEKLNGLQLEFLNLLGCQFFKVHFSVVCYV